jgi:hypothetical protein
MAAGGRGVSRRQPLCHGQAVARTGYEADLMSGAVKHEHSETVGQLAPQTRSLDRAGDWDGYSCHVVGERRGAAARSNAGVGGGHDRPGGTVRVDHRLGRLSEISARKTRSRAIGS